MLRQRITSPELVFRVCSILLALVALTRASSYYFRPPDVTTSAGAAVIESGIGYDRWPYILASAAVLILAGTLSRAWVLRFFGHLAGLFAYSIFAMSIIVGAFNEHDSWTSAGAVAYVALAHAAVVIYLGLSHGRR